MTVMCFVESPRGHSKVLKGLISFTFIYLFFFFEKNKSKKMKFIAWDHLKELKKEDSRFRTLVNNLGTFSFQAEDKEVIDFLVTSLMFINAVIHAASDLDFRIHIRNEFYAVEFAHILEVPFFIFYFKKIMFQKNLFYFIFQKLKGVNTEYSQKQIQVFENAMTEDYDELLEFFDQSKIDFQFNFSSSFFSKIRNPKLFFFLYFFFKKIKGILNKYSKNYINLLLELHLKNHLNLFFNI